MFQQIYVGNVKMNVDVAGEVIPYFEDSYKARITEEKISSPSPFRYDKSPSFLVNLVNLEGTTTAGTWLDSGTGDTGKLEHLLAYFRNETVEETIRYLHEKYGVKAYDKLKLNVDFKVKQEWKPLLFQGDVCMPEFRGLTNKVIHNAGLMDLGDKMVFHWYKPNGVLVAIKYRYKDRKDFYYEKGGKRLNEQLYNIQRPYEQTFDFLWVCEGEIDALSVESYHDRSVGVAMGGASFSDKQRDAVIRTGLPNVIIATDNDKQGHKVAKQIENKLASFVTLFRADMHDCKDINEYVQKYNRLPLVTKIDGKSLWK